MSRNPESGAKSGADAAHWEWSRLMHRLMHIHSPRSKMSFRKVLYTGSWCFPGCLLLAKWSLLWLLEIFFPGSLTIIFLAQLLFFTGSCTISFRLIYNFSSGSITIFFWLNCKFFLAHIRFLSGSFKNFFLWLIYNFFLAQLQFSFGLIYNFFLAHLQFFLSAHLQSFFWLIYKFFSGSSKYVFWLIYIVALVRKQLIMTRQRVCLSIHWSLVFCHFYS